MSTHGAGSHISRERGATLVELMIALTLGLVLSAGLIQVFTSNKQIYRTQAALSSLEENGRFAIDLISRDLRNAGFYGCSGNSGAVVNTLGTTTSVANNFSAPLQGYEANSASTWNPTVDSFIESPAGGTDILVTRHPDTTTETYVVSHVGNNIKLDEVVDIKADDVVLMADCANSVIFKVASVSQDTDNLPILTYDAATNLGRQFTISADVEKVSSTAYFIRQTGTSSGRPGLWRREGSGAAQEVVEGVENMQIRYGVDTDNDKVPNQYYTADAVADWSTVMTVRLELLLSSVDNYVTDQAQAYTFNGTVYDGATGTGHAALPTDRRYRQTYLTTIALRNTEL